MTLQRKRSNWRNLPGLALVAALVACLCTACGGSSNPDGSGNSVNSPAMSPAASASSEQKAASTPIISTTLANKVMVEFKTPDQLSPATATISVANPSAPAAFQGVGVNLVGATDLLSVPCVAKAGGAPCPAPGPNPAVSATSIRAAINLPFGPDGSYLQTTNTTPKTCSPFSALTEQIDYNDPAKTNAFFDNYSQTKVSDGSGCTTTPQSIADRYGVDSANQKNCSANYSGACMIADVTAKNLDWVQVYFAVPGEFTDVSKTNSLAALEAAQLVYQTRFGNSPKYVELRNEPDNDHITPAQYTQFVVAFNNVLPRLVQQRSGLSNTPDDQKARLKALLNVQIVGPGLTAAYKIDYPGDTASNLPKDSANSRLWNTLWFQADGGLTPKQVAQQYFNDATAQKVLLSSHVYDEKHILADGVTTLDALAGLKNLFRVRDAFQPTAPSPVMLTEMAESVEHDVQTNAYMSYCKGFPIGVAGNACGIAGVKDQADGFNYGYPNCLAGKAKDVFGAVDLPTVVDMCHNQAATLNRNIINYANQGVMSELVWSATPTPTTTRHGLLSSAGAPTLMNGGTEPLFKAVSTLGYTTVYPTIWKAPYANTTVDAALVLSTAAANPPAPGYPATARVALANTDSITRSYAIDFGSTPFAQFTQVTWACTIGGAAGAYTGTAIETTSAVLSLPAGTTFGSDSRRLVITLPARSAVTLDLKR